ncbi:MAG: dTMP kinase [Candidatus Nanohaloarchaea archaeon]|nr:dTMP kinase [Candidatus Nanohaloarchaea archaeon]
MVHRGQKGLQPPYRQQQPSTVLTIQGSTTSHGGSNRYDARGTDAEYIEFPTYDRTRIGALIQQYLDGNYDVPPEVAALLYAADRYQMADEIRSVMAGGGVVVADRYSQSNYAFQAAAAGDDTSMLDWMQQVESRLPQPDLVILLDIPPETARELMRDERKEQDVHEEDLAFQRRVADRYRELARQKGWTVIDVVEDGELRSKEDIAAEIWDRVEQLD